MRQRPIEEQEGDSVSDKDTAYLRIGNIEIDRGGRQVYCCGQPVELTWLQFNLLVYLCDNANRVCFYGELLEHVWHYDPDASDWYIVRLDISRLRKSFQDCLNCKGVSLQIRTVRQIGYSLQFSKSSQTGNM